MKNNAFENLQAQMVSLENSINRYKKKAPNLHNFFQNIEEEGIPPNSFLLNLGHVQDFGEPRMK